MKPIVLSLMLASLAGCQSLTVGEPEFSCKGRPGGLRCMGAKEVYALTDNDSYAEDIRKAAQAQAAQHAAKKKGSGGQMPQSLPPAANTSVSPIPRRYVQAALPEAVRGTIPLRTPAQVMRIYVAPWESENGDLNVTGYVYVEVEPRRWQIGNRSAIKHPNIRSIQRKKKAARKRVKKPSQG